MAAAKKVPFVELIDLLLKQAYQFRLSCDGEQTAEIELKIFDGILRLRLDGTYEYIP